MITTITYDPTEKVFAIYHGGEIVRKEGALCVYQVCQVLQDIVFNRGDDEDE